MFNTDKFIVEVEARPPLYDMKCTDYNNKEIKQRCWDEVGLAMYEDWNEMTTDEKYKAGIGLITKWKTVRDNFVREYKSLKSGTARYKKRKYVFYDQLLFLLPHVKAHRLEMAASAAKGKQATGTYQGTRGKSARQMKKRLALREVTTHPPTRPNRPSVVSEDRFDFFGAEEEKINNDKFGNKAFLMSFLPMMDGLSQHTALDVRMKITEVFKFYCTQQAEAGPEYLFIEPSSIISTEEHNHPDLDKSMET